MRLWLLTLLFPTALLGAAVLGAGCAAPAATAEEVLTVEGRVSLRGNAPFAKHVLETPNRNLYVLDFSGTPAPAMSAGRTYRVTGVLYADLWAAGTYAHLRVQAITEQAP